MQNNNIDIEKLRSYINDLEEQITPLTKTKSKSKHDITPIEETQDEPITSQEPEPIKKKITRTVTEKKKEQLIKAREIRKTNTEKRNKIKKLESAKLLLQDEITKPKKEELVSSEPESSSEEPEIVIVKKPKVIKKKKPKKKIIIQDDESTEESSEEPEPVTKQKQFGKSHRNKKSVIKIHDHPSHSQPNYNNFFC
jgi:hypothetical protein